MRRMIYLFSLLAVLTLFTAGCDAATLTFTWDYDFTLVQPCSATLTTSCIKDFAMYGTTGAGTVGLIISCPAPPNATAPVVGITCTVSVPSKIGNLTFTTRARAIDWQGNPTLLESLDSNASSVTVKPDPAKNFAGK